jgi:hypothetical protein
VYARLSIAITRILSGSKGDHLISDPGWHLRCFPECNTDSARTDLKAMKPSLLLLPSLALAMTLSLASCGDGHGSSASLSNNPPNPTSGGDDSVVNQNTPRGGEVAAKTTAENTNTGTTGTIASQGSSGGGGGSGEEGSQPIPEPATFFLLGTGLAAAAVYRRRKAPQQAE